MLNSIFAKVISFIQDDKQFWFYHSFGLTFFWIIMSTLAIFVRKIKNNKTKWIHILLFVFIDYGTLFLGGAVFYKYWGEIYINYSQWSTTKQIHALLGVILLVVMTIQHIVGVALQHQGKFRKYHIKQGYILHCFVGIVATCGWLIRGNLKLAVITIFIYILGQIVAQLTKKNKTQKTNQNCKQKQ